MAAKGRLEVKEFDEVTVVRFQDRKILDQSSIDELGAELMRLVDDGGAKKLLLNFTVVDFMSSAALGKLIMLDNKVKQNKNQLVLCAIRPQIYEVFKLTKLNQKFKIVKDEAAGLAEFK